ncbi:glycosyltransferase family 25 protein [Shewanella seohaensis]|uniref:Glycosyltransferase family 25 protein n=1 Tax=Shewanella seohaensis TaxID=755175 RepID=A0ABV4VRQ1_9GAMM
MLNVISLKKSLRRQKFNSLNIKLFDAIEIDHEKIFNTKVFKLIYGREPRNGEIGCALSHYYIAKQHVETPVEWSLVLEDDAIFECDLLNFKNTCPLVAKPTILVLGHSKTKKKNLFVQRLIQPLRNPYKLNSIEFGHSDINFCGTVGYMANRAASELIAKNDSIFWLADDWRVIRNMGVDVVHIKEPLVYEDFDGVSSTGNKVIVEHDILKKPLQIIYLIILNQVKRYFFK